MLEYEVIIRNIGKEESDLVRFEGCLKKENRFQMFGHAFAREKEEEMNYVLYYWNFRDVNPVVIGHIERDMVRVVRELKDYLKQKGEDILIYRSICNRPRVT